MKLEAPVEGTVGDVGCFCPRGFMGMTGLRGWLWFCADCICSCEEHVIPHDFVPRFENGDDWDTEV